MVFVYSHHVDDVVKIVIGLINTISVDQQVHEQRAWLKRCKSIRTTLLHFAGTTSRHPAVIHAIPKGKRVSAVTSLGNDVFVVRYYSQQIEVYDVVTFTLQRCLAVPELGSRSYGLAACPRNKCLYASDRDKSSVHRVELSGSNAVMKWSVASGPAGLTVNRARNLLVVSQVESKLQEFTTHGTLPVSYTHLTLPTIYSV